ncbi:hypothetical protein DFH11DRAFT_1696802 [Phellopilus nigrolimitatus]|nr:hypothetical protein DFH11DRAFT_1696802 [Phellopilus nigrolimitatus]
MLSSRPISLLHNEAEMRSRTTASKTPGRALKGRAGLQENAFQHGSMTANPKEKRVALQTPFRSENGKTVLQDVPASSKAPLGSRTLVDKTPLPNRQNLSSFFTPGPRTGKIAKFSLPALQDENETGTPLPPSSSRKKLRVPRSTSKNFETPITIGDHWNVSDVSIDVGTSSLDEVSEEDVNGPDYSEPEYMPPKAVEPAYEPPFELPDYRVVGETLRTLAYSYPMNDSLQTDIFDSDELLKGCGCSSPSKLMDLTLPESDEDDIFGPRKAAKRSKTKASARMAPERTSNTTTVSPQPVSRAPSRAQPTQLPRPATSTSIRSQTRSTAAPASSIPRPGTSTATVRRPLTRNATSAAVTRTRATSSATTVAPSIKARSSSQTKAQTQKDPLALQFGDELEGMPDIDEDFMFNV